MTSPIVVTAHHEAAHAVVKYRATGEFSGSGVNIIERDGRLGSAPDGISDSENPDHLVAVVLSCYAGAAAQQKICPSTGRDGCDTDDETAEKCLEWLGELDSEAKYRRQAADLVDNHWDEITAVAMELIEREELDETEVETIADCTRDGEDWRPLLQRYRLRFQRPTSRGHGPT